MRRPRAARFATTSRSMLILLLWGACAFAVDPRPSTSRLLPAKALTFYIEYDGLDAHSEAWKATAAYAMIHRQPTGQMVADISKQVIDRLLKSMAAAEVPVDDLGTRFTLANALAKLTATAKVSGDDVVALHDHLFQNGFTIAVYDHGQGIGSGVIVLRGLGRKDARERFGRLARLVYEADGRKIPAPIKFRGRELYRSKPNPKDKDKDKPKPGAAVQLLPAGVVVPPPPVEIVPAPPDGDGAKVEPMLDLDETWWFERDDLIIVEGPSSALPGEKKPDAAKGEAPAPTLDAVALVLDAIEGKAPNASTHPAYKAALAEGSDVVGFESNGFFFLEPVNGGGLLQGLMEGAGGTAQALQVTLPSIPDVLPKPEPKPGAPATMLDELKLLGLDQVKRLVGRWGFQGKALLCDVRIEIPAPRKGLAALLDQPSFRKDRLPPIPRGAGSFALGSFDAARTFDRTVAWLKTLDPAAAAEVDAGVATLDRAVKEATGQRLREDLLRHLGPTWCMYAAPDPRKDHAGDAIPTLLVEVDDAEAFARVLDALATRMNNYLRDLQGGAKAEEPAAIALVRLPAPEHGYRLASPAGLIPWLTDEVEPTILLGKSYLVVAANPALARAAALAESQPANRWTPADELANAFACLPPGLTSLSVGNPSDSSWPELVANLPKYVQFLGNFVDVPDTEAVAAPPGSELLTLLGVPRAGGFRVRIDPSKVPRAIDIRALLFPSVLATAVDDRGLRFISREAIPFACLGAESNTSRVLGKGPNYNIKMKYGPGL
jgi:hypothetical protein